MFNKISLRNASIIATLWVTLVSCKKDSDPDPNSAAFKIDASEKLTVPSEVSLPDNLPGGNTRVATYYAMGVQKYAAGAVPNSNPVTYQWVFVEPRADLYDHSNKKVGTHYAGPTWSLTGTQDLIVAQKYSPEKKSTQAESIDWLLLMPKANTTPTGKFSEVDYVQRIATTGGKAPSTAPTSATQTVEVEYTAIYRFTKMN